MALFQLWYMQDTPSNRTPRGSGEGTIDAKKGTATVTNWTTIPALEIGTKYKLKAGRPYYEGICATVNATNPVATFRDIE